MRGVALKGLAGRKIRALLTAFAIVIGVSMVSGTFILTDTMQKSFNGLFDASYEKTDAVVQGKEIVKNSTNGSGVTLPASLLDEVKSLPEVEAAGGIVMPEESHSADIIGKDGEAVAKEGIGTGYDSANARFSPLNLKTGAWPEGAEQVVIDAGTAKKEHLAAGDSVAVDTATGKQRYEITGTASYGEVDSLGFGSIAVWDLETAQTVLDREGRYDGISIAAKSGTSADELIKAVQPLVPSNVEVQDSAKQAEQDAEQLNDGDGQDPGVAARLRRHRAARRGVRDLQHLVDHGRAAHTRVRHAADPRRVAQAGHALGPARRARDRAARVGDRARGRARDREGHGRAVQRPGRRPPRGVDGRERADRDRLHPAGHGDHAAGEHPARPACDTRAANRGGAGGFHAPAHADGGALAQRRHRRHAGITGRDLARHLRRRRERGGGRAPARRWRARAVRRHRAARAASRQAARPRDRPGRRVAPVASQASWRERTPSATPAAPRRPQPR